MREKMERPNKNFSLSNSQQSTQMILGKSGNHNRKLKRILTANTKFLTYIELDLDLVDHVWKVDRHVSGHIL